MKLGEDMGPTHVAICLKPQRQLRSPASETLAELSDCDVSSEGEKIGIPLFCSKEDVSNPEDSVSDTASTLAEESFRIGRLYVP